MKTKKRLDIIVSEKFGLSRTKAQALIMAGEVLVEGLPATKVGQEFSEDKNVEIKEKFPYVSRGALKLEHAAQEFKIIFKDKIVCDVGASTGGFTDFALQAGAKKVYAIDTGRGQIAEKIRRDKRVVLLENTNIKNVRAGNALSFRPSPSAFIGAGSASGEISSDLSASAQDDKIKYIPEPIDIFVIDVSFISLKKVLPVIQNIIRKSKIENRKSCDIIALIKPQFEVGKAIADKTKGVIRDPKIHADVVKEIGAFAESIGFSVQGLTESPITGAKGNKEFLMSLRA